MKQRKPKGGIGSSCSTAMSVKGLAVKRLSAELELRRLGNKPKNVSHGNRRSVQRHIADGTADLEYNHVLIDYKNDNEVIKKSVMSRKEAGRKNKVLKGSGFAWALGGS